MEWRRTDFEVFLVNIIYGMFARLVTTTMPSSTLLRLSLIIGYVLVFTLALQKFGNNSLSKGVTLGVVSLCGSVAGWIIMSIGILTMQ